MVQQTKRKPKKRWGETRMQSEQAAVMKPRQRLGGAAEGSRHTSCWATGAGSGGAAVPMPLLFRVGSGNRPWPPAELQHLPRMALTAFKGIARNRCGHPAARVGLAASACPFSSLSVHFPRSVQPRRAGESPVGRHRVLASSECAEPYP